MDVDVVVAEAFGRIGAADVLEDRESRSLQRGEKRIADPKVRLCSLDLDGARSPVPLPLTALVRLQLLEKRKALIERPAFTAQFFPRVVFARFTAHEDHPVH